MQWPDRLPRLGQVGVQRIGLLERSVQHKLTQTVCLGKYLYIRVDGQLLHDVRKLQ